MATFPDDGLSSAQLGFLYLTRNATSKAMPLLDRVMNGPNEELANRVRATLRLPVKGNAATQDTASDARLMADKSIQAGYLKDALKYLSQAHDADPLDADLMLKLASELDLAVQENGAKIQRISKRSETVRPQPAA